MSNNSDLPTGNLIVVTAPSGAGKSTLVTNLRQTVENIDFSISYTTRSPRLGEQHGREYYFIDIAEFEQMRARNEFLEWAEVHGNFYGTHQENVKKILATGKDIILDIDVQGAVQVRHLLPEAILIFIMPPSLSALSERLYGRASDSNEVIARRLLKAREEITYYDQFDYVVINDDLDKALQSLATIVRAQRLRPSQNAGRLQQIVTTFQCDSAHN
jgi:guanylate kinase